MVPSRAMSRSLAKRNGLPLMPGDGGTSVLTVLALGFTSSKPKYASATIRLIPYLSKRIPKGRPQVCSSSGVPVMATIK